MAEDDNNSRSHLTVVAECNRMDIERNQAVEDFSRKLRVLAANLMRIARGAGEPGMVMRQCHDVFESYVLQHKHFDRMPSDFEITKILSDWVDDRVEYDDGRYWDRMTEMERIVSGSLRTAAARLLEQKLQAVHGEKEMLEGIDSFEYERAQRRAELAATKSKNTRKGSRKRKDDSDFSL